MLNDTFFRALGWVVVGAMGFSLLGRLLRLPGIVSYLLAGICLGPLLGVIGPTEGLATLSELGIVLLLFLVGLELNFSKIRDVGFVAIVAGLGQVLCTTLCGWVVCLLLGLNPIDSLVVATALTFSSTVVVVKILSDKLELDSLHGRIAVGILLVQDFVVILILTILSGLEGGDGVVTSSELITNVLRALGETGLLLIGILISAKYLLPKPMAWAAGSPSTIFIWGLCWCFCIVAIAYKIRLSPELGAFLAGISLAQLPGHQDLHHRIKPVMNFFVAIFFVTLGLQLQVKGEGHDWASIIVLSLFVLLGKPAIILFILSRFGYRTQTGFYTGLTLAQVSEFSFILVTTILVVGVGSGKALPLTTLVGVITIAASSYLILYNKTIYHFCRRFGFVRKLFHQKNPKELSLPPSHLRHHIIIVGMNTLGRTLAKALHERGERVLAIDTDADKLKSLSCLTQIGSTEYLDVLMEANLPSARMLISALQIEEANELLAYRCKQFNIPCCVHATNLTIVENLLDLDVKYLMLSDIDGARAQSEYLRKAL